MKELAEKLIVLGVFVLFCYVSYLFGAFLAFHILVAITVICIAILMWMAMTFEEIEGLLTILFGVCFTVINLVMWATYYFTTNQSWVGEFFLRNVLR